MKETSWLSVALGLCLALTPVLAQAWQKTFSGSNSDAEDVALAVAVDTRGDVFAVGSLTNENGDKDFTVMKLFRVDGTLMWRRTIDFNGGFDEAQAVTVDSQGDVIAVGALTNAANPEQYFFLTKLDGVSGDEKLATVVSHDVFAFSNSIALAVTVDSQDSILAAGRIDTTIKRRQDFTVFKVGPERNFGAEIDGGIGESDSAGAIAVDSADNVIAVGWLAHPPAPNQLITQRRITVIKFNPDIVELWRRETPGFPGISAEGRKVAVDSNDDIIAAGQVLKTTGPPSFSTEVMKLAGADGEELWRRDVGMTDVDALALDANGNPIVGGWLRDISGTSFVVIKLGANTGDTLWDHIVFKAGDPGLFENRALSLAVDSAGIVTVVGVIDEGNGPDFVIRQFDGATGQPRATADIDGSTTGADDVDAGLAVTVDEQDNIIAAGFVKNNLTDVDFAVVKRGPDLAVGPADGDGDGIEDIIDLEPDVFSFDFSDIPIGGATWGTVLTSGELHPYVLHEPADPPHLPEVTLIGFPLPTAGDAVFDVCTPSSELRFVAPGAEAGLACFSVDVKVIVGPVMATFNATDGRQATTTLGDGQGLVFDEDAFTFAANPENTEPIVIVADGMEVSVDPGKTFGAVNIDIKPGSFPNSINLGSGGSVPVAILGTADFDATSVDPTSVTLESATVRLKGNGTPMASPEDVNGDGFVDLVVHVSTEALTLTDSDTEAVVEGTTTAGVSIQGTDLIRVVP
jgi:hypothetical protein